MMKHLKVICVFLFAQPVHFARPSPKVRVDGTEVEFEVDTGAAVSLVSEATYNSLWFREKKPQLERTDVVLRTYTGEQLAVSSPGLLQGQE